MSNETNVESNDHSATIEVTGDNVKERAKPLLDALQIDGEPDRLYIEMESRGNDESGAVVGYADETVEGTDDREKATDGSATDSRGSTGRHLRRGDLDEEPLDVQPGGLPHRALTVIYDEAGREGQIPSMELRGEMVDRYPDINPSSVSATLTELYRGWMADREKVPPNSSGGVSYAYWLTEHGEETIEDLGPAEAEVSDDG